jgi:Zn-dependent protease
MKIKEIYTKAGPLSGYAGYFLILFLWIFLDNIYTSLAPVLLGSSITPLLSFGVHILVVPLISAGVFGGIHLKQQTQEISSVSGFFAGIKQHYGRMLGAYLLYTVIGLIISIIAYLISMGFKQIPAGENNLLLAFIAIPLSAISLFWLTAAVVERRVFRGLLHAVKILFNPYALTIGILWGAFDFAYTHIVDTSGGQLSYALYGILAGVLAAIRVVAIACALAIYKQVHGMVLDKTNEETPLLESPSASSGDGLVKASFGFAFVAFIPLLHFVTLSLGIKSLRQKKRFVLRSAIAICLGGFFTIFYIMIIMGWIVSAMARSGSPGYTFMSEANAELQPQVILLEQRSLQELERQLEQNTTNDPKSHWTVDSISALTKYYANDLNGALEDFRVAAEKKPDRSEFYYYYGIALLENGQADKAAQQFQTALAYDPQFDIAKRYLNLVNTTYNPSIIISSLMLVIILLILFTLHEYGHAYAAWKLGDDTAKNQGRLTLNPIPHLDPIGSIILPGILLWQQAGVVFGWAKPVPVNPGNFQDPKKDHMRVSFAGPAVNLMVCMVCFVILGSLMLFVRLLWPETLSLDLATPYSSVSIVGPPFARWLVFIVVFLKQMFYTSLVLGCFNLLPIPPLDGSWILSGLLPQRLRNGFEKTRRFGWIIFLLLVLTPVLDYFLAIPILLAEVGFEVLVSAMGLG